MMKAERIRRLFQNECKTEADHEDCVFEFMSLFRSTHTRLVVDDLDTLDKRIKQGCKPSGLHLVSEIVSEVRQAIRGNEMSGLPKEITEFEWYKNLPTIESRLKPGMEKYREELAECGIDLDELGSSRLTFLQSYLSQRGAYGSTTLKEVADNLDALVKRYDSCFEMGFGDVSMNTSIAIKEILGE